MLLALYLTCCRLRRIALVDTSGSLGMLGMTRRHLSSIHNYPAQMISVLCLTLFRSGLAQCLLYFALFVFFSTLSCFFSLCLLFVSSCFSFSIFGFFLFLVSPCFFVIVLCLNFPLSSLGPSFSLHLLTLPWPSSFSKALYLCLHSLGKGFLRRGGNVV